MSNTSIDFENQQQLAARLSGVLDTMSDQYNSLFSNLNSQIALSHNLVDSLDRMKESHQQAQDNFTSLLNDLEKLQKKESSQINDLEKMNSEIQRSEKRSQNATEQAKQAGEEAVNSLEGTAASHRDRAIALDYQNKKIKKFKETNMLLRGLDKVINGISAGIHKTVESFKMLPIVQRAAKTSGLSLLFDIPRLIVTGLFKIIGSIVSGVVQLYKTAISLPFMIANIAADIGNMFRTEIIENIGNAYQSTKEYSDANSLLGKGISNLRGIVEGSIVTFQNPRSTLTKLFGFGFAGAQKFLTEVSGAINDMGPLAELYGHQITNSSKSAVFLTTAMKGLGITSKELAYYALDAGVQNESIFKNLTDVKNTITNAADMHDVDAKQVSLGFQKLRTNIKDFGHLTNSSISNLVARMRQLNIEADDLTGIFNKYTSFEEAAKTSAMLYQSFGMNVDALNLLTAQDPGEIVDELRDAMYATGKSYEELNRHEKALLSQTTGLSDATLKSMMSFNTMHLSYSELKDQLADQDPTQKNIESIKSLTSSIKEIQKVMNFKSPFEAFFKGLSKNASASTTLKQASIAISNIYQDLYTFGLNMDKASIEAIMKPMVLVVKKMRDIFVSNSFQDILVTGTNALSRIFANATGGIGTHDAYKQVIKATQDLYALENSIGSEETKKHKQNLLESLKGIISNADGSVVKFLQKRNILTSDKEFARNLTIESLLAAIKSASIHIKSDEGKKSLTEISEVLGDFEEDLLVLSTGLDKFKNKRGVQADIDMLTDDLMKMYEKGSPLFGTIIHLGKSILGGIIKGGIIAVTAFLEVMAYSLSDQKDNTNNAFMKYLRKSYNIKDDEVFTLGKWLGISDDDRGKLSKGLEDSLRKVTEKYDKIFSITGQFASAMMSVFTEMANAIFSGLAAVLLPAYDDANFIEQGVISWYTDIEKLRRRQMQNLNASGFSGITSTANAAAEKDRKFVYTADLGQPQVENIRELLTKLAGTNVAGVNVNPFKYVHRKLNEILNNKVPYYTSVPENFRKIMNNFAYLENFYKIQNDILSVDEWKRFVNHVGNMKASEEDKKSILENYTKSYKNKINEYIEKPFYKNRNNFIHSTILSVYSGRHVSNIFQDKAGYKATANYAGLLENLSESSKSNADLKDVLKYNSFESNNSKSPKNKKGKIYNGFEFFNGTSIKDGAGMKINSIMSQGGLKLFLEDGRVVVPHSLDQLVELGESDKSSLASMFGNLGFAYSKIAEAKSLYKNSDSFEEVDEYEEIGSLVKEFIEATSIALDLAVNRKIDIKSGKLKV